VADYFTALARRDTGRVIELCHFPFASYEDGELVSSSRPNSSDPTHPARRCSRRTASLRTATTFSTG
jgi:hypothetical protein